MSAQILLIVTHLLGAGHLTRTAALGRALSRAGHRVTLASGGMPITGIPMDGLRFEQLPPVRAVGTDFRTLRDASGEPISADRLPARREMLSALLAELRPDVLVTELHPFGRRVLADEFDAVVRAARLMSPRPVVVCSIRDVLAAPGRPERVAETHKRLSKEYDAVLVHGDREFLPLDLTWPLDDATRSLLHYTGYVDDGDPSPAAAGPRLGVLVSGGSSAAGRALQNAALGAAALLTAIAWRVLVGHGVAEADFAALRAAAPPNVEVERARRDFRALLGQAALSVSQAGYNTVVDLLATGCPSLLVPFEGGGETEQRLRAEHLVGAGIAAMLPENVLSAETLAAAVTSSLARTAPPTYRIALDGAARTVEIVEALLARRGAA